MSSPTVIERVSIYISVGSYFLAFIAVCIFSYKELKKRRSITILSWNGKSPSSGRNTTSNSTATTNSKDDTKRTQFISRSMHYLSITAYVLSIIACIGGMLRGIPNECEPWSLVPHLFGHGIAKAAIYLFQLQRFYSCFVKDFVHSQSGHHNASSHSNSWTNINYNVIFFYFLLVYLAIFCPVAIVVMGMTAFAGKQDIYSWNGIWCTFATEDLSTRYGLLIQGVMYLTYDWFILILFFFTIRGLSKKLYKLSNVDDHNNVSSRSQSTISRNNINNNNHQKVAPESPTPKPDSPSSASFSRFDSNSRSRDRSRMTATMVGIEKLKWILMRIFICSVVMEVLYTIGSILAAVTQVGTLIWAMSYVCYAADSVINVLMINLMLQHNTSSYKRFIQWLSNMCCCIAGYINYENSIKQSREKKNKKKNIVDGNQNEKHDKRVGANHVKKVGIEKQVDNGGGGDANLNVVDGLMNQENESTATIATTFDEEIMPSQVNHDKRISGFTVDKSYFHSEISKDDHVVPDPL